MTDDVTEVEIKADPPQQETEVVIDKADGQPKGKIITADEGLEDLKAQVARAKAESERRLGEAQRQIAAAQQRAIEAEHKVVTVEAGAVSTVIDSLKKDKDAARRDYRVAMETGDYEKAADAQDRLSLANARLVEAEKGKLELEAQARNPSGRNLAQPVYSDDVERFARSLGSKRSADWVRAHPEYVVNGQLAPKVMAAHFSAVDDGIAPDSDEYFAYINRSVSGPREAPRQEERYRAPTAAPVARDVAQSPGAVRPGVVKLTASEVNTARALDMSLEDYARYKQQLTAEGKIGRMAS